MNKLFLIEKVDGGYRVLYRTNVDDEWASIQKAYKYSTSAYAAIGRMVIKKQQRRKRKKQLPQKSPVVI